MTIIIPSTQFTKEKLFADLEGDGITADIYTITKANDGDGGAMNGIGYEYQHQKQNYDKAMAWYRLAAIKNNYKAQNNIGVLYDDGLGVPQDYLVAMEWYLKAAMHNIKVAWGNIGNLFENGQGVPVDKYKALEWYVKSGNKPKKVKALTEQGFQLTQEDKYKTIEQLIMETEELVRPGRYSNAINTEINSLKEEIQSLCITSEHQQKEINTHLESIDQYKRKEQTINNELQALKQANHTATLKMEAKDNKITLLEKEIKLLQIASENSFQDTTKRMEELERSNQRLERMLEQERQLKDNQIEVLKEKMKMSLEKEKQKRKNLEKENQAIKRELKSIRGDPTQENTPHSSKIIKNDSNTNSRGNGIDYDTEYDNCKSDDNNDTSYDTPSEEDDDDDNNDLNYDSDEQ